MPVLCVTLCPVHHFSSFTPVLNCGFLSLFKLVSQQSDFEYAAPSVCNQLYGVMLAAIAVWQTKTAWLSSDSLQTDLPASGCRATTQRFRNRNPWNSDLPLFLYSCWHFDCPSKKERRLFPAVPEQLAEIWTGETTLSCSLFGYSTKFNKFACVLN